MAIKSYKLFFVALSLFFSHLYANDATNINSINDIDSLLVHSEQLIRSYKYQDGINFAEKALSISIEKNDLKKEGDALFFLANGYLGLQKHWTSLDYFNKSKKIKMSLDDKKGVIDILNFQGIIYWRIGLFEEALSILIEATKIMEKIDEYSKIIAILNNIGLIHNFLDNPDTALEYFKQALDKSIKFDDIKRKASIINNIGIIYQKKEKYNEALQYFFQSLELKKKNGDKGKIANTLQNIGSVYFSKKNNKKAEEYYKKGLSLHEEINDKRGIANNSNSLANMKIKTGDYQTAIGYLNKALKFGNESNSKFDLRTTYELLSEVNSKTGNYEKALMFLKECNIIKGELITSDKAKKIAEMQEKYEAEHREKELTLLKKNTTIQQLEYKRNMSILIAVILLIVLISFMLHFQYYKNKIIVQSEKEKLEDSLKLKADFTAMLVHDLRSPLSAIMGTVDLLKIRTNDKKILDVTDMIKRGSLSMLKLVNEMLDLSKFEAGKMQIIKRPYKIDALIRESAQILEALAESKQIDIKMDLDPTLPEINIDPTKIDQVVTNILANAIKFSSEGFAITVQAQKTIEKEKEFIEVSIEDSGPGIDPSLKNLVFDKYAQLHNKSAKVGSGLGLAVSKLIIDAHDGTISFKPSPEQGSIFYFRLPII